MAIIMIDNSTNNIEKLPFGNIKGNERIVQNIRNILNTYKYEIAYNRDFGLSPDIIDNDIDTVRGIIIENLFDNIQKYEPRAALKSVEIKELTADGGIVAVVKIEV